MLLVVVVVVVGRGRDTKRQIQLACMECKTTMHRQKKQANKQRQIITVANTNNDDDDDHYDNATDDNNSNNDNCCRCNDTVAFNSAPLTRLACSLSVLFASSRVHGCSNKQASNFSL